MAGIVAAFFVWLFATGNFQAYIDLASGPVE